MGKVNTFYEFIKLTMQHLKTIQTKEDLKEVVEMDCQAHKLNKEDAMDCNKWSKLIKDVWSFGTSPPG